jgi:hypothetical protein
MFEVLDLRIDTDIKWEISSYQGLGKVILSSTSYSGPLGVCHDVLISMGGVDVYSICRCWLQGSQCIDYSIILAPWIDYNRPKADTIIIRRLGWVRIRLWLIGRLFDYLQVANIRGLIKGCRFCHPQWDFNRGLAVLSRRTFYRAAPSSSIVFLVLSSSGLPDRLLSGLLQIAGDYLSAGLFCCSWRHYPASWASTAKSCKEGNES